ncbi:hypothetical protein AGOR_G00164520 [Albula goreensis]|uniref:FADD n=1 Tax=Albula goreensis TaxID=1534307 RepID=A0A8T3CWF2_9TELE|nr:hypothetical protein AGOR_G00164520 [Albula goreensis]
MDPFAPVLLAISDGLTKENVEAMKFMCSEIGKKRLEKIDNGIQLFQCLREMNLIGADNTRFLRHLLNNIKRADLLDILTNFETHGPGPQEQQLDPEEQAKLNIAKEVISEQLGKNWRKYGRKLGISDSKLEHISTKHPFDLMEQIMELLKEWQKMRGPEAKVDLLIGALRACDFNLTADRVQKRLSEA